MISTKLTDIQKAENALIALDELLAEISSVKLEVDMEQISIIRAGIIQEKAMDIDFGLLVEKDLEEIESSFLSDYCKQEQSFG